MWYDELFSEMERMGDSLESKKMGDYMQNKFKFLGIKKPILKTIMKPYLKNVKNLDWDFVNLCWQKDFREAQYVALEHIGMRKKDLKVEDLEKLKTLIIEKSWWETVDTIDAFVGILVQKNPSYENTMLEWSVSDNMWLRRTAIDCQQEFKENTNTELLEKIVCNNLGSDEFFINKAIGWSLRDYSKVNPEWVKSFLDRHKDKMSKLSIKEAGKYL